jgi:hypothetical protein
VCLPGLLFGLALGTHVSRRLISHIGQVMPGQACTQQRQVEVGAIAPEGVQTSRR